MWTVEDEKSTNIEDEDSLPDEAFARSVGNSVNERSRKDDQRGRQPRFAR
jgi:hypothetical protein